MTDYICEHCNHKFSTQKILIKHQTHAKYCLELQGKTVQKYNCPCGNKYVLKDSMQRHQLKCKVYNNLDTVQDMFR